MLEAKWILYKTLGGLFLFEWLEKNKTLCANLIKIVMEMKEDAKVHCGLYKDDTGMADTTSVHIGADTNNVSASM